MKSLSKVTSIGERYQVQFRAEIFNSFFRTNQAFDNTATNATFRLIVKAGVSAPNFNYPRAAEPGFKLLC